MSVKGVVWQARHGVAGLGVAGLVGARHGRGPGASSRPHQAVREGYHMSEIVKAGPSLSDLGEVHTESEVRRVLAQLELIKDALKAADMFRDQSVRYARYEAYALVRAVEISGDGRLVKGKWRRQAAEWLAAMPEDERERWIAKCEDGKTIDNVYKDAVFIPEQRDALGRATSECKGEAVERLRSSGAVNVQSVISRYRREFPKSMMREITDGVRSAVKSAGGVGIGDGGGTYIDPDKNSDLVADAIRSRIDAVVRVIESIADLASRCESKPVFHIRGCANEVNFGDVTHMILAGVGCATLHFDTPAAKRNAASILRQIAGDM